MFAQTTRVVTETTNVAKLEKRAESASIISQFIFSTASDLTLSWDKTLFTSNTKLLIGDDIIGPLVSFGSYNVYLNDTRISYT